MNENKCDLKEVLANYSKAVDQRQNSAIDQEKVDLNIKALIDTLTVKEKKMHTYAEKASKWLIEQNPNGSYRREALQLFMVARILANVDQKIILSIHPPGTGKSWIAALLVSSYN